MKSGNHEINYKTPHYNNNRLLAKSYLYKSVHSVIESNHSYNQRMFS